MTQATALEQPGFEYIPASRSRTKSLRDFIRREPLGTIGAVLILLVVLFAIAAPLISTHNPQQFSGDVLKSPSGDHFFGTTREGKDVYSRVIYGARVSLKVGVATVLISLIGGTALALLAGFLGGAVDWFLSRTAEILISLPQILFALTLRTAFREDVPDNVPGISRGELLVIISICIVFTPIIFRVMRGAVLEQRNTAYIESARVLGASQVRIMVRHILPNLAGLIIILSSTTLPAAILLESGLSFLGVGVEVGTPSWGADLSGSARSFFVRAPWIAIFPGLALSIAVLAFNLLGDSLRDTLDPRLRGKI
jgi:peptide/nickel transport system permease protein